VPTPAQIKEMDSGKAELQEYMNALLPTLNAALNTLAKTKPADPVASLAALLSAGGGGAAAPKAEKIAGAMTAEELAKKDKEELEAKKKAEAKKQAEKDAVEAANIKKMNELEASGKKVSGGMHKFDSSEVDVNGGNATADDFMDAFGFGDGAADVSDAPSGGDIDYGVHLKAHIEGALVEVLKKCPADPFKAIQQILFQASLENADPPPAAPRPSSDEVTKFMELYNMENEIEACLFKLKKRCVTGPKDGAKFLVSDAGDFFTEKSKALKAQGGPRGVMTAEELKAADAAAAKAKREKEAKAEAERDAADALNAKKTAEMEAQGKKVSGGLHKFDASEVDINGGSGTADDFMDAFGF
jgi:hypothetical protein